MTEYTSKLCKSGILFGAHLERIWGAKSALDQIYRTSLKRTGAPVALGRNWGARAPKHSSD